MIFELAKIQQGISKFRFQLTAAELELDYCKEAFTEAIVFSGQTNRSGDEIIVKGTVATKMKVQCSRCLKPFYYELAADVEFVVKTQDKGPDNVIVWDEDYVIVDHYGTLDTASLLRDLILLELPLHPLCDQNCKGLCPICGKNLNEGPCSCEREDIPSVWGPLERIKEEKITKKIEVKDGSTKKKTLKSAE
ncbi:DUF177 domain-containing protein [bacterium]|nr:DUF177 domain-containing protein [bacterium]